MTHEPTTCLNLDAEIPRLCPGDGSSLTFARVPSKTLREVSRQGHFKETLRWMSMRA